MPYSAHFRERTGAASGEEPLYLLEIAHPQFATPVRIVDDTQDIVSSGNSFSACEFGVALPDSMAQTLPRAPIWIDNVGRELTAWLEASIGGKGATVRMMQVMRDTPDVLEADFTLDLLSVKQGMLVISGELGYEDVLNVPGMIATYRPNNTPGLFG
jgi:hypothetical protein